jgi:2-hydroxy-3-keto-5-methylthiopentenyl-1-phosphate phosphatase
MLVILDFDGTVSTSDTVDALLDRHADVEWRIVEQRWESGEINAQQCMAEQFQMLRLSPTAFDDFRNAVALSPGFDRFLAALDGCAKVAVVSDGVAQTAAAALDRSGFAEVPVYANQIRWTAADRVKLDFPHHRIDCEVGNGVCKCAVARQLAEEHSGPVVLVGDGRSDFCVASKVDYVFAKASLLAHCLRHAIECQAFEDFRDIVENPVFLQLIDACRPHPHSSGPTQ